MKEIKKAIDGLNAIQTRMAMILLRINGRVNALEFIEHVKKLGAAPEGCACGENEGCYLCSNRMKTTNV